MPYSTKFSHLAAAIFLISLSGCAQDLERLSNDLRALNQGTSRQANSTTPGQSFAQSSEVAQNQPIQLILPNDKKVEAAANAALPNIKLVIAKHSCMKTSEEMRLLNFHAVPGKNFPVPSIFVNGTYPNSDQYMKYHDRNKCIGIRALDQWSMPALNALRFRVVYFAEDSGETVNFQYEFKRVDDGSWKLDSLGRKD